MSLPCLMMTSFKSSTVRSKSDKAISILMKRCYVSGPASGLSDSAASKAAAGGVFGLAVDTGFDAERDTVCGADFFSIFVSLW